MECNNNKIKIRDTNYTFYWKIKYIQFNHKVTSHRCNSFVYYYLVFIIAMKIENGRGTRHMFTVISTQEFTHGITSTQ